MRRRPVTLGNRRNTVSRVLFQETELTEFCGKLGEFCEKLGEFALAHTLHSEIITQLIPRKLFRAMITRISRNPARNNYSGLFWHNDEMAIAQIKSWKHATSIVSIRATTTLRNRPDNNCPRVISRNRLRQFRAIPRNKNSSVIILRAQCCLNGGLILG